MQERDNTAPLGRLVLVMERQLTDASKITLRGLLAHWWQNKEVTWVSGLSRASVFDTEMDRALFYNRRFLSPEHAVKLLPWREVWLVADGRVWKLDETSH
ncbi:MAG: hypothetical protein EON60_04815 [Alphaproteobacteria bacterium]|nr:MAG: hypothetical protein EON60_04815 [Alphaproteobacteria bacterium]